MRLHLLEPGTHFTLPHCGKQGTVLYHSPIGTTVRYDGARRVSITPGLGDPVEFIRANGPVLISGAAEVSVP